MYILDIDPYESAACLTKKLVTRYIKILEYSFSIYNGSILKEHSSLVVSQIMYSMENYLWFSKFYEALQELYKSYYGNTCNHISSFKETFLYDVNKTFDNKGLKLPSVADFPNLKYKNISKKQYLDAIENIPDVISRNRIMYILNNYNTGAFITKAPSWYTTMDSVIYCGRSVKDRRNIKITLSNGGYKYYTSTISDKWNEIKDVPADMSFVINSLLNK